MPIWQFSSTLNPFLQLFFFQRFPRIFFIERFFPLYSLNFNFSAINFHPNLIEPCHRQRLYCPIVIRCFLVSSLVAFRRHLRAHRRIVAAVAAVVVEYSVLDCALRAIDWVAGAAVTRLLWWSATCFSPQQLFPRTMAKPSDYCGGGVVCMYLGDLEKPLAQDS